ncbi:MAG: SCO family protein [Polyangiales bacterium]
MNRGLAGVLLATSIVAAAPACDREPELPVLATVPDFSLVDDRGRPFGGRDLEGHVVVADFIFTRCTTACPMLTAQMSNFRRRLGPRAERVRFVSFSVDPDYDTPEVLHRYAATHGASGEWYFVTGDVATIRRTAIEGFKVGVGDPVQQPGGGLDILHAQHFVLLDRQRRIRGFYRTDSESLGELERAIDALLEER